MARSLFPPPRNAGLWVPLLTLPMAISELIRVAGSEPAGAGGLLSLGASSAAISWYVLGGTISWGRLRGAILQRWQVSRLKPELDAERDLVWAVDAGGRVVAQSGGAFDRWGDHLGASVSEVMGGQLADAQGVLDRLIRHAFRHGSSARELPTAERLLAERAGSQIVRLRLDRPEPAARLDAAARYDALPIAVIRLDKRSHIVYANRAARPYCGDDSVGQHLSHVLEGLGRPFDDWLADARTALHPPAPEVLHAPFAGQDRFVQIALYPDGDDPQHLLAVLSDARALKTLEAQFVQSQKMQAIGQLAGGIAHDFNNILTAIGGYCDLLMLRRGRDDPDYADLDQINQNANRAASLVGHLLAFSRKQTLKPQRVDLRETFSDLSHLLNRLLGETIALEFRYDPVLQPVRADRSKIEQVIMNLVVNARDAMPDGGNVNIVTTNVDFDQPQQFGRFAVPPGRYVRVSVLDEGCGMTPDIVDKVFEPFFTTKRVGEGTGLGLSTVYGIVKQTGGYVMCASTPGKGTKFCVYLPVHTGEPEEEEADPGILAPSAMRPPADQTVLLVEDEAPVRTFASRALRLSGYHVLEAESGEAALSILADDTLEVDVFVSDVVMPGLDGPGWVRRALKDRPGARVIFMSGYTEDVFDEGRSPVENALFLQKPFSLTSLVSSVADASGQCNQPSL